MAKVLTLGFLLFILVVCLAPEIRAQTTEFTFQGTLKDGANPANGNYDLEFLLFDSLTAGTQQGSTLSRPGVAVANGTFAVKLDFGSQFPGANRFLEIHVRTASGGAFTTLAPRQSIGSSPYAVQSLNAATAATAANSTQLGGIPVNGFILNTTSPQATSNLNISGNGIFGDHVGIGRPSPAAFLDVTGAPPPAAQIGNGTNAETVLQIVGPTGGASDGQPGSFGGNGSNISITAGDGGRNPAFPASDGTGGSITLQPGLARPPAQNGNILLAPTGGNVGIGVGNPLSRLSVAATSPGAAVSVTNSQPGISNPSPVNLPPAALKGEATSTSDSNAGVMGIGDGSAGIGVIGITNGGGSGGQADAVAVLGLALSTTGTSTGVSAQISSPNGAAISAKTSATGLIFEGESDDNSTPDPKFVVTATGQVKANSSVFAKGFQLNSGNFGVTQDGVLSAVEVGTSGNVNVGGNLTIATNLFTSSSTLHIVGSTVIDGTLTPNLQGGGNTTLCTLTGTTTLRFCSSSLRYKNDIHRFRSGLDIVNRLQPITFRWKENGEKDIGLGAEDVAKIDPLLVTYNNEGGVEGVKYAQLNIVLINAVKEQQAQIEALQKTNTQLETKVNELEKVVCSLKPEAEICKTKGKIK